MRITFGMIDAACRALDQFMGDRLCRLRFLFFLRTGLLGLFIAGNLFAAVKQLEALPDDNDDKGRKKDFRKTQHIRSQSMKVSVTIATDISMLYSSFTGLETGKAVGFLKSASVCGV